MYNQLFQTTFNQFENIPFSNPFINDKDVKNHINSTKCVFDAINSVGEEKQTLSSLFTPINENKAVSSINTISMPSYFWISYASEQVFSPISIYPKQEKRLSTEIVKRYSLSELTRRIYLSEASYYATTDVVLSAENMSDKQWEAFFDYEKELLDVSNLPMNFNYHFQNKFFVQPNNVLIFEK